MKIIHKLLPRKSKINFNLSHQQAHKNDEKQMLLMSVSEHIFMRKIKTKRENNSLFLMLKKLYFITKDPLFYL